MADDKIGSSSERRDFLVFLGDKDLLPDRSIGIAKEETYTESKKTVILMFYTGGKIDEIGQ